MRLLKKVLFCLLLSPAAAMAEGVGTSPGSTHASCRALVRSPDGTVMTPLGKGGEREIPTGTPGLRCRLDGARPFPGGQVLWPVSCWSREKSWEAAFWSPDDTGPDGPALAAGHDGKAVELKIFCQKGEKREEKRAAVAR